MTTDQGANMKKAMALYNEQITTITWIPCASHKIQICINNSLKRHSSVSFIFQRCKDIVVIFAGSSAATEILGLHQKILFDGKEWKLLGFNKTRWNSWFIMAARVHKLMPAILASIRELEEGSKDLKDKAKALRDVVLCDDEIDALGEMLTLLQPAANFTHWAGSATRPTLSHVYARVYSLLPPVESLTTPQAQALHASLSSQIKESWPLTDIPDAILLAIYFNPACASSDFLMHTMVNGESLLARAKALAAELIVESMRRRYEEEKKNQPLLVHDATMDTVQEVTRKGTAFLAINLYTAFSESKEKMKVFMDCPQDFWLQQRTAALMELTPIALSYLCIQATSSSSERAFSQAGLILDQRRACTADHNFQAVILSQSFARVIPQIVKIQAEEEAARLQARRNMFANF